MKRKFSISEVVNILLALAIVVIVAQNHIHGNKHANTQTTLDSKENVTLSTIHERKSVRNFIPRKMVSKEDILSLVKAGMAAPTARNAQPWEIIAITDTHALNVLGTNLPYAKMLAQAGAAIIVCGNMNNALEGDAQAYWIQDCSAATQNILLAAESMGLGAVWTGVFPIQDRVLTVKEALHLPSEIIPLAVIPIGYPTGVDKAKVKFTETKLHWEKW
ncbi:MAG: nitroreductase family protein [Bacteroidales bacterium]